MKYPIVSVRLPEDDLRKMKFIALVCDQHVGAEIRLAVSKHIAEITATAEFQKKAHEFQRAYSESLAELTQPSKPSPKLARKRAKSR